MAQWIRHLPSAAHRQLETEAGDCRFDSCRGHFSSLLLPSLQGTQKPRHRGAGGSNCGKSSSTQAPASSVRRQLETAAGDGLQFRLLSRAFLICCYKDWYKEAKASRRRRNRTPACLHAPWVEATSEHQPDSPPQHLERKMSMVHFLLACWFGFIMCALVVGVYLGARLLIPGGSWRGSPVSLARGCSSNGRALAQHARGTGIDAQLLHFFKDTLVEIFCVGFMFSIPSLRYWSQR